MKRRLLVILGLLLIPLCFGMLHASAQGAPYPATLDLSGYGPYHSGLIQPTAGVWYAHLDYTPLNGSASLTIENQNQTLRDVKLIPANTPGSIMLTESGLSPIYLDNYAGNWHMWLSY